jgi:hypothetical protein
MIYRLNFGVLAGLIFLQSGCALMPFKKTGELSACPAGREYITTSQYLKRQKNFNLEDQQIHDISQQVAQGCRDAAKRFIQTTALLSQAGFATHNAIENGLQLAHFENDVAEAFIDIFSLSFFEKHLDLDLQNSLRIAHTLSTEFSGKAEQARNDFKRLVRFCTHARSLDLPKPTCANLAQRVALVSAHYPKGSARAFINLFEFIRSPQGPGLTTGTALQISEEITSLGVDAPESFRFAYRYATSDSGLKLSQNQAVDFARSLSSIQPSLKVQ